ncbi:unnamed protein product [Dibothriocephalus latus]|uniref:Uncharacterized protein n=1 Tax=Dibothriocephalus latus TaxID=60516 RepID=A0A3P7Q8E4_DIBLA|nr:unnamed protein product [Dibothriocephalus latus]
MENSSADALTMSINPLQYDRDSGHVYAGTFDPPIGLDVYGGGCEKHQLLFDPHCHADLALPAMTYTFRSFSCNPKSMLCAEGNAQRVTTKEPVALMRRHHTKARSPIKQSDTSLSAMRVRED